MDTTRVIVGIDGSAGADRALGWAAAEADRRAAALLVVHGSRFVRDLPASDAAVGTIIVEKSAYGHELLADAARYVAAAHPALSVTTELHDARARDLLVTLSSTGALTVVGSHGESHFVGALLGSVSQYVVAHAEGPVAVVGGSTPISSHAGRIVVGVSASAGGRDALRFAFAEAASRHAVLVAVRAYGVWGRTEHAQLYAVLPGLSRHEAEILEGCVDAMRVEYPNVVVESRLVDTPASEALPQAGEGADLLIIGGHEADARWPSRLGPIASALLHRAPCPVLVVGQPVGQPAAR